jgi:acyl carrier protein
MSTATIVTHFIVDQFAPDIEADQLDPDYDLLEGGIIDSLGLLTIVAWIEDRFGVAVDAGEIGEDDLRSVRAVCSLIEDGSRSAADDRPREGAPG